MRPAVPKAAVHPPQCTCTDRNVRAQTEHDPSQTHSNSQQRTKSGQPSKRKAAQFKHTDTKNSYSSNRSCHTTCCSFNSDRPVQCLTCDIPPARRTDDTSSEFVLRVQKVQKHHDGYMQKQQLADVAGPLTPTVTACWASIQRRSSV
jgi:hypothetical protein